MPRIALFTIEKYIINLFFVSKELSLCTPSRGRKGLTKTDMLHTNVFNVVYDKTIRRVAKIVGLSILVLMSSQNSP